MAEESVDTYGEEGGSRQKPCLNWDDELPPIEVTQVSYNSNNNPAVGFNDALSDGPPMYSTNEVTSRTLLCTKNSGSPSEDDILQKINVSNIIGEDDEDRSDVTIDMIIPTNKVGLVIGKGGKNIKALQEKSGAKMQVIQHSNTYDEYEKTLRLVGPPDLVQHARQLVYDLISRNQDNYEPQSPVRTKSIQPVRFKTIRYPVPKLAVGLIIGRGGETIKRIRTETGAKVQFEPVNENLRDMDEQPAIVSGKSDQIRHACDLIEDLVNTALRGYQKRDSSSSSIAPKEHSRQLRSRSRDDDDDDYFPSHQRSKYTERRIPVPVAKVKLVLGRGRETIKGISMQSGAYCDMDRDGPIDGPDRIFLLKGLPHQVEFATELIMDKLYGKKFSARSPADQQQRSGQKRHEDGPVKCVGNNEWGQGDPSSSWACMENASEEARNSRYAYSQWLEYFQPERQQAQADAWEQKVKAEQVTVNCSDSSEQPEPNLSASLSSRSKGLNSPQTSKGIPRAVSEDWSEKAEPIEIGENTQAVETDPRESDSNCKLDETPKIEEDKEMRNQYTPTSSVPPSPPNFTNYQPLNSGCTRIVTLYYDINNNSVVVLNQWHCP